MSFAAAEKIADAVLYEGYALYPYRASAVKNQLRWQFGVLMPRGYSDNGGGEPWFLQAEFLIEPGEKTQLDLRVRFLAVLERRLERANGDNRFSPVESLEINDQRWIAWEEGIEQQHDLTAIDLLPLIGAERAWPIEIRAARSVEPVSDNAGKIIGRITRERFPISATIRLSAEMVDRAIKVRVRVENLSPWDSVPHPDLPPSRGKEQELRAPDRTIALRQALVATHLIAAVRGGAFLSLTDPPEWARAAAASCDNRHTWPVLVGERNLLLSAPIILEDYPKIAPESAGDLFDATEVDELLALRTMTLTDQEKQEARATDERTAAIIERIDAMPPESLLRLHGAQRPIESVSGTAEQPWWTPEADASVSPETETVEIGGITIRKGSAVRLQPSRRADAQDMFLIGREAIVQGVFRDVDGGVHVAVDLTDDPAAELRGAYARYYYFAPDELIPLQKQKSPPEGRSLP